MDPIANVDRLVLLLRQRLLERSRASSTGRTGGAPRAEATAANGLDGVHTLASVDGVDDRQLRRALIQSVLADQFGPTLLNEAKFQQVVERVTETMEEDAGSARLLSRLVTELRATAR